MRAGTRVEVETESGCYRGALVRSDDGRRDIELRCAGHYVRLHRWCVRRVRVLDEPVPPR